MTSSSLEVLAGLSFSSDDELFRKNMVVCGDVVPPFYSQYVEFVQKKIEENAHLECQLILKEHEMTKVFFFLFILCYLLFIIYYLLFIIYYLLFIIYYLLFIIYYLLFIIYYLLFIIYYLLFIIYYLLFIIYYLFSFI